MKKTDLINKIKSITYEIYVKRSSTILSPKPTEEPIIEYDEISKFPELKKIIISLLTTDYAHFIDGIDWVSPRPTTFRINLLNGQSFYLIFGKRSWIAEVEGKKYYLLNLSEEQSAAIAIARILRYGSKDVNVVSSKKTDEPIEKEPTDEPIEKEPSPEQ